MSPFSGIVSREDGSGLVAISGAGAWSDGLVSVVCDARLDNRAALASALAADSNGISQATDAELIARAYARWGPDCAVHLLGDFAFAVWDQPRRRLLCARDPIGVRPFYYAADATRVCWAGDLESLIAVSGMARRPDETMIADYLLSEFRDPEATFFEGCKQLPPAQTLSLEGGILRGTRFWMPTPQGIAASPADHDALEGFRAVFRDAVRGRLQDAPHVGILLSGGTDSTSVAGMMAALREADPTLPSIAAFTIAYEDVLQDEWEVIRHLTQRAGMPLREIRPLTDDGALAQFDWFISHTATPYYHGLQTHPRIFETAAQQRCGVMLTGIGGDELLGIGLSEAGMLSDLLRHGRLVRFQQEIRRVAWTIRTTQRAVLRAVLQAQASPRVRWMTKAACGRQVPSWIAPAFAKRQHLAHRIPRRVVPMFPTRQQEQTWQALTTPAFVLALNQLAEASAAFGVECRHPFLDRRLIEYVLALPPEVVSRFGQRKGLLQEALKEIVPGGVRARYGEDSTAPDPSTIQTRACEVHRLAQCVGPPDAPLFQYVDAAHLARFMHAYVQGDVSLRSVLWKCASLARWLHTHVLHTPGSNDVGKCLTLREAVEVSDTSEMR